jgi:hypothetical protein
LTLKEENLEEKIYILIGPVTIDEYEWLFMVLWCDGSLSLLSLWLGKKEMAKSTVVGVTFCCLMISLGIFSWFSSTRLNPSFYCWMRLARFVKSVYESKGGDGGFCSVV